jgi:hypothetical protein
MSEVIPERLAKVGSLARGSHDPGAEMCVMEAVAFVAGETWSDAPQCACPVITAFLVSWNDSLPSDAERDLLLKDLIPEIVGTRLTPEVEERRSYLALDWLIRVFTPKWLDLVPALHEHAKALRELEAIADMAGAAAAGVRVNAAGDAAWDAAGDAAWAAARAAAGAAAWDAAWNAAGAIVTYDLATPTGPYTIAQRDLLLAPWISVMGPIEGLVDNRSNPKETT